jgi:3-phenylpropionate/cinnamic acid dioxygenase small subunit
VTASDDRDAVRNLLGRYCEIVDGADWRALGELFADAALCDERGEPFARGADEVSAFFARNMLLYDGSPRTKHLVLNTVFEQQGENAIVARSSYVVFQGLEGAPPMPIAVGWYGDTFRGSDGTWAFVERRYGLDFAGDLSTHFTWGP